MKPTLDFISLHESWHFMSFNPVYDHLYCRLTVSFFLGLCSLAAASWTTVYIVLDMVCLNLAGRCKLKAVEQGRWEAQGSRIIATWVSILVKTGYYRWNRLQVASYQVYVQTHFAFLCLIICRVAETVRCGKMQQIFVILDKAMSVLLSAQTI